MSEPTKEDLAYRKVVEAFDILLEKLSDVQDAFNLTDPEMLRVIEKESSDVSDMYENYLEDGKEYEEVAAQAHETPASDSEGGTLLVGE